MMYNLNISFEDLHLFYQVVTKGGYLKAAKATNICQAKASRRISHIEHVLGTKLLNCNMRQISLTAAGEKLFKMARVVLEEAHGTLADIRHEQEGMEGEITLAATSGFGNFWLLPLLWEFSAQYPKVIVRWKSNDLDDADLMMGEADIVISTSKPSARESMMQELLCRYPCHLYASTAYLKRKGVPQSVEDLDHHHIVAWSYSTHVCLAKDFNVLLHYGRDHLAPRKPSILIENDLGIVQAVSRGFGLGWMPTFLGEVFPYVQRIDAPIWHELSNQDKNEKYISYLKKTRKSKKHLKLINFIKEKAKDLDHSVRELA